MGKKVNVSGLRTSEADEEMFAIVTKFFGNRMCEVKCADGATRMCIIRKKFSGRTRRNNMVSVGATIMVGLRDWEKNEKASLPKCDLLEVYTDADLRKLKQKGAINMDDVETGLPTICNDVEFVTGTDRDVDDDDDEDGNGKDDEIANQPTRDFDLLNISDDSDTDSFDNVDIDDI
jgi:initiation factor 1A